MTSGYQYGREAMTIGIYDDDAATYHRWFAWYPVQCHDVNGVRKPDDFFITKWLTHVYRRSAVGQHGRHWVYTYEDPYEGWS